MTKKVKTRRKQTKNGVWLAFSGGKKSIVQLDDGTNVVVEISEKLCSRKVPAGFKLVLSTGDKVVVKMSKSNPNKGQIVRVIE